MDFRSPRGVRLLGAFTAVVLFGCGGGSSERASCVSGAAGLCNSLFTGGNAGNGSQLNSAAAVTAATLQFLVSSQQLSSAGTSPV